ncbi:MAG: FecR family protein [Marivibrio sp.]|uniref:FecR family protein n=1 Tax=Marivibrio sp. TaxID=2039719 RepID=UPI0032ECBB4A
MIAKALMRAALAAGLVVAAADGAAAQQADQAGVSAAVSGEVLVARADAVGRQVTSGEAIYLGDAINAGPDGSLQVLLMDESVFTLGPQSRITIDRFIYDPAGGSNSMTLSMTQGAMRFVAGKIAGGDPDDMRIVTPVGQIGIRGTIGFIALLTPEQAAQQFPDVGFGPPGGAGAPLPGSGGPPVVFAALAGPGAGAPGAVAGSFTFSSPQGTVDLNRPGGAVLATPGQPPVFFIAPPGAISALGQQTGGGQQEDGGGPQQGGGQQQGGSGSAGGGLGGGVGGGVGGVESLGGGQPVPVTQVITVLDQQQQTSDDNNEVTDVASVGESAAAGVTLQELIAANAAYISGSAPITGAISGLFLFDFDFAVDEFDMEAINLSGGGLGGSEAVGLISPFLPLPNDTRRSITIGNNGEDFAAATTPGCTGCSLTATFPTTGSIQAVVTNGGASGATAETPF